MKYKKLTYEYHLMLLPVMIFLIIFNIIPMFGIIIAFKNYMPGKGIFQSDWAGLQNFSYMFMLPSSWRIFRNTMLIAIGKIVGQLVVPVVFALFLNEIKNVAYKKSIQTVVYLPHFLSWVVLATPIMNIFSYSGIVNKIIAFLGGEKILFLSSNFHFPIILILTDVWKEFGFGAIVYLAAITGIDSTLYEAAEMDGASRWQKMAHVTFPGMLPIIILMLTRSLGNVLNAGFDQVFNLYSPAVYESGDIIDTFVYRVGLLQMDYSLSTAVGLMKSVISIVLIVTSYKLAYKYAGYTIF